MSESESEKAKDDEKPTREMNPTRTPSFFGSSRNGGERERKRNVGKIAREYEN